MMARIQLREFLTTASTLAALSASTWAGPAYAQGLTLNRYSPSETRTDGFHTSRPEDTGHMSLDVTLHLDYSNDPLVIESSSGHIDTETSRVVSDQLGAELGASFGLWHRLVLFGGFTGNLLMKGEEYIDPSTLESVNTADGPGLGDGRLGARLRILGQSDSLFALAGQLSATAPLSKWSSRNQNYSGDASASVLPELLGELRISGIRITSNLGTRLRKNVELSGTTAGDELQFALALTAATPISSLDAIVEGYGATTFQDFGQREVTPFEVLAGGRYNLPTGLTFGLAAGPGLTRGIGSPDFRIVGMVGFQVLRTQKKPPELPPIQTPSDTDGDGLLDSADGCPMQAEDLDHFEDDDGCPDLDNDKDGIADAQDRCPIEAEDKDKFEDDDGCPDLDNDKDGIADAQDRCPIEAEDKDKFEDDDGCPDLDNDKDTVPDLEDECPHSPGPAETQGCPKSVRIDMETGELSILQQVQFALGKATILSESYPLLQEVRDTLNANPQLAQIRVEGHTDSRGADDKNLELSQQRAASVARWLSENGVQASRLKPFGCGETKPVADNQTAEGRQQNRRVVFQVVEGDQVTSEPASDACVSAD